MIDKTLGYLLQVCSLFRICLLYTSDYFFDGIIADWMVQSKIKDARFQVDKAIRELNRIKNTLLTLAV